MIRHETSETMLTRLKEILDLHGADKNRWPPAEREALRALCGRDQRARDLLAEARAFDTLLDLAPSGSASGALTDRITSAAIVSGDREARIIPISAGRRQPVRVQTMTVARLWPAAGLLAASLAVGLYLGINGLLGATFDGAVQIALSATGYEEAVVAFDLGGEVGNWEDLL